MSDLDIGPDGAKVEPLKGVTASLIESLAANAMSARKESKESADRRSHMLQISGAFLILLILLLAIPVNLVCAPKKDGGWRGRIIVYWMFGLVHVSLRPRRERKGLGEERRSRVGGRILSGGKCLVKRRRAFFAVLRTPGFMRRLMCLLRDVLQYSRPRRVRIQFVIGMDDPADTGRL